MATKKNVPVGRSDTSRLLSPAISKANLDASMTESVKSEETKIFLIRNEYLSKILVPAELSYDAAQEKS